MVQELRHWTTNELPETIPIFPLAGVLLLPGGNLPLNIFESRYIEMTEDAMSTNGIIGMIQPADPYCQDFEPLIYNTGCAGQITTFEKTEDNRILITITGICRFEVENELPHNEGSYRRVTAHYQTYKNDLNPIDIVELDRDRFIGCIKTYFSKRGIVADWSAVDELCNEDLITSLTMACPFEPSEKQALLECKNTAERISMFHALLNMAAHDHLTPEGPINTQ